MAMAEEHPEYCFLYQYGNDNNPMAHYEGTGPEIFRDCPEITHFVAGLGTSGTLMGTGRYLKEQNPDIKIIAIEPPLGERVEGLRNLDEGYIPPLFEQWYGFDLLDRKRVVRPRESLEWTRALVRMRRVRRHLVRRGPGRCGEGGQRDRQRHHRVHRVRRWLEVPQHRRLHRRPRLRRGQGRTHHLLLRIDSADGRGTITTANCSGAAGRAGNRQPRQLGESLRCRPRVLSDDQVGHLHATALSLLQESGLKVLLPEARRRFADAGAQVDESTQMVRFDSAMVEAAVATAPSSFEIIARNPGQAMFVGDHHMALLPVGGPPYVSDLQGGRRPGTLADFETFVKLAQRTAVLNGVAPAVEAQDVDLRFRHLHTMRATLTLSDKVPFVYARGRRWWPTTSRWSASPTASRTTSSVPGPTCGRTSTPTRPDSSTCRCVWPSSTSPKPAR